MNTTQTTTTRRIIFSARGTRTMIEVIENGRTVGFATTDSQGTWHLHDEQGVRLPVSTLTSDEAADVLCERRRSIVAHLAR